MKYDSNTALILIDIQEFYFSGGKSELVNPEPATLKYDGHEILSKDVHNSTLSTLSGTYATIIDTEDLLKKL
jgi:hypothetical protein